MSKAKERPYTDQGWWKHLVDHFKNTRRLGEIFEAFVHLAACAVSAGRREEEYMQAIKHFSREDLMAFSEALALLTVEMEHKPFEDLLGPVYQEISSHKGKQMTGEFYTPRPICQLMVRMTALDPMDFPKDRPVTVCEPAGGTGGMILAFVEFYAEKGISPRHFQVTHQELLAVSCHCAFINYTLWGIPAVVYHMNTLSLEVFASWTTLFWPLAKPYRPAGMELLEKIMGLLGGFKLPEGSDVPAEVRVDPVVPPAVEEALPEGMLFDVQLGPRKARKPQEGEQKKNAQQDSLISLWEASNT